MAEDTPLVDRQEEDSRIPHPADDFIGITTQREGDERESEVVVDLVGP